jgi:hypothetical protein
MKKLTAAWIRKAESDFRVAKNLAGMHPQQRFRQGVGLCFTVVWYNLVMISEGADPDLRRQAWSSRRSWKATDANCRIS